jgi:hypothetical protein
MSEADTGTNYWAVLIGINFYVKDTPLQGCLRDVECIKQYLESLSTPLNIDKFTASTPSEPNSRHPAETPDSWPTFENVTRSLKKIISAAKPGNFVYIHYSGHGAQTKATSSEYCNKNTGDLALVLFDDVHGSRYLRGLELAYLLNEMVNKGLFVTLVLDCCFSGSVVRHSVPNGAGIRATDYDPAVDAAYPQKLGTGPGSQIGVSILRDGRILPTWLVNPKGYTILTACGPHERAQELEFPSGERNGALSHFLVRALRGGGAEITHQSLYQHLRVRFRQSWPQQNPMRYGNENFSFFGKLRPRRDMTFSLVYKTQKDGYLCLEAGHAHGVFEDDEYALYPLHTPEDVFSDTTQAFVKARVEAVRALTSDLVGINPTFVTSHVGERWKARPLTHLAPQKVPVRLMSSVNHQPQWIAAAKQRRFLHLSTADMEGQPCMFNVTCNEHNEYEILDGSCQKIPNLPTISLHRQGALDCVVGLLEHLATFKYIEGIENRIPNTSFQNSFRIHINGGIGDDLGAGLLDVNHEGELSLTVRNTNDKPLYLYIYDLGPSWQIDSLICDNGGGDYKVMHPKKEEIMMLQMTVPDCLRDRGQCECEDVIKVFVTSKPTSFAPFMLPKIPIPAEKDDRSVRGDRNQLSELLSGLATPIRGEADGISDEQWACQSFVVRTRYGGDNVRISGLSEQ